MEKQQSPGTKYDIGKLSFALIPSAVLKWLSDALEYGKNKYDAWNWSKGIQYSRLVDSTKRHLDKWFFFREENDLESGVHHLGMAMFGLMCLTWFQMNPKTYKKFDDRPNLIRDEDADHYYKQASLFPVATPCEVCKQSFTTAAYQVDDMVMCGSCYNKHEIQEANNAIKELETNGHLRDMSQAETEEEF